MSSAVRAQQLVASIKFISSDQAMRLPLLYCTDSILRDRSSYRTVRAPQVEENCASNNQGRRGFSHHARLHGGLDELEAYAVAVRGEKGRTRAARSSKPPRATAAIPLGSLHSDSKTQSYSQQDKPNAIQQGKYSNRKLGYKQKLQKPQPASIHADRHSWSGGSDLDHWSLDINQEQMLSAVPDAHSQRGRYRPDEQGDDGPQQSRVSGRALLRQRRWSQRGGNRAIYQQRSTTSGQHPYSRQASSKSRPIPRRTLHDRQFLPFERKPRRANKRISDTSTITDAEAMRFQELLALPMSSRTKVGATTPDIAPEDLHFIISQAIGVEMSPTPTSLSGQVSAQQTKDPAVSKAAGVVRRVTSLLQDARTDSKMWEIIQDEAFAPVLALRMDGANENWPEQHEGISQAQGTNKQILSEAFPKVLVVFQDVLQKTFPSSPYALALLPHLRQLGPTIFALGASTELYNQHLRSLYRQRTNIQGMVDTLQEMHEEVFDFDSSTQLVVDKALSNATRALERPINTARCSFWSAGIRKDSLHQLEGWASAIRDAINDKALYEAGRVSTPRIGYVEQYGAREPLLQASG